MTCSVPLLEDGVLKDSTIIEPKIVEPDIVKPNITGGGSLDEATAKDFVRDMCTPLADCISKILESTWLENIKIRGLELDGALVMSEDTVNELYQHIADRVKETSGEVVADALKEELDLKLKHVELTGHVTVGEDASTDIFNSVELAVKAAARSVAESVVEEVLSQPLDLTLHGSSLTGGVTLDATTATALYGAIVDKVEGTAVAIAKDQMTAALKEALKVELSDSKFTGRLTIGDKAAGDIFQSIEALLDNKYSAEMFKGLIQDILDAGLSNIQIEGSTLTDTTLHGHLSLDAQSLLDLQNALSSWVDSTVSEQVAILGEALRISMEDTLKVYIDNKWEMDFGTFVECSLERAVITIFGHPLIEFKQVDRFLPVDGGRSLILAGKDYEFYHNIHGEHTLYDTVKIDVYQDSEHQLINGGAMLMTWEADKALMTGVSLNKSLEDGATVGVTFRTYNPDSKSVETKEQAIDSIPLYGSTKEGEILPNGTVIYSKEEVDELLNASGGGGTPSYDPFIYVDSINGDDVDGTGEESNPLASLGMAWNLIESRVLMTGNPTRSLHHIYLQCDGEYELWTYHDLNLYGAHVSISTYGDPVYGEFSYGPLGYEWRLGAQAIRPKLTLGWDVDYALNRYNKTTITLASITFEGLHIVVAEPPQGMSQRLPHRRWVSLESAGTIKIEGCIIEQMQKTNSVLFSCSGGALMLNCVRLENDPTTAEGRQLASEVGLISSTRYNAYHAAVEESGAPLYTPLDDNVKSQSRPASSWVNGAAVDTNTKTMFGFTTTWDIFAQADR